MILGPISVVIPLFSDSRKYVNRLPLQRRQWIALSNQTDMNYEIVAVDNASHDNVLGLYKEFFPHQPCVRHMVPNNRPGARLAGVQKARFPYVVTLDAECIVWPHYVENWKKFFVLYRDSVGTGGCAAYVGPILSGREYILGMPPKEKIDYVKFEKFVRDIGIKSIAGHYVPPSFAAADSNGIVAWPHNWAIGFSYANAGFPRKVFIDAATPDAHLIGYGYEDKLMGLRLQHAKVPTLDVSGMPYVHQCHRSIKEKSGLDDCANLGRNLKVVERVMAELAAKKK